MLEQKKFLKALDENPGAVIGLSALLTTTMENMKKTVIAIKEKHSDSKILVGGAPVLRNIVKKLGRIFILPIPKGQLII